MKAVAAALTLLLIISTASAQGLPKGVEVMVDYAVEQARGLTFLAAYLGGILTFLSPCVIPLLFVFLAMSHREQANPVKMTLAFFLGLATVYALMGAGAFYLGGALNQFRAAVTPLAGVLLILMGVSTAFGRGFTLIKPPENIKFSALGVYSLGASFAVGFTPCVGPIYAGILFLSSFLQSPFYSAALMVFYTAGVATPLFAAAVFRDRVDFSRLRMLAVEVSLPGYGRRIRLHPASLAAGVMLAGVGTLFLLYGGTYAFNFIDPLGTKKLFYGGQRFLLDNPVGGATAGLFLMVSAAAAAWVAGKTILQKKHGG